MQFELKIEKRNIFCHLKFDKDISFDEAAKLYSLIEDLLVKPEGVVVKSGQSKLGEFPVPMIDFGEYKEPEDGVRIKMLHFIERGKVSAFMALKNATGIPPKSCREVLYGNYPCPIMTDEKAKEVLEILKIAGVYAKIVPAFENKEIIYANGAKLTDG